MFSPFSISCALFIVYRYLSPLVADIATSVATCLLPGQMVMRVKSEQAARSLSSGVCHPSDAAPSMTSSFDLL